MRLWVFLTLVAYGLAQEPAPIGIVRGSLLECDAAETSGELSIRTSENRVFRFMFDPRTYIERDRQRITVAALKNGDALEIVSDRGVSAGVPYARTVHVLEQRRQQPLRP